jgi:hypothetical protein
MALLAASLLATGLPAEAAKRKKKPAKPVEMEQPAVVEPSLEQESSPPPAPPPPVELAPPPPPPEPPSPPPPAPRGAITPGDWRDVGERPGERQLYVGLRYHGTVIPRFMMNIFVDGGATAYSNTVGIELDVRHDHYSVIPSLSYTEYGLGETLFLQKNHDPSSAANWSDVSSGLKAIYASVDFLWSTRIHRNIDLEYGLGVGLAILLGDLTNNWVYSDPNGALQSAGARFSACRSEADGFGCSRIDHGNSDVAKVGGYIEPSWFSGGVRPSFYLRVAPLIGLRFKPLRDVEARFQLGFSLTEGFFFGLSGNYRLPTKTSD